MKGPVSTGWDSFENLKFIPSGESARQYRRTVYTHDDWKKHRDQDRFIYYLQAVFTSGVYKNLTGEVVLATLIATFVCFWNCLVGEYQDLESVRHAGVLSSMFPVAGLPLTPFTLASPSLGLLLGTICHGGSCFMKKSPLSYSDTPETYLFSRQFSNQIHPTNVGTKHAKTGE